MQRTEEDNSSDIGNWKADGCVVNDLSDPRKLNSKYTGGGGETESTTEYPKGSGIVHGT